MAVSVWRVVVVWTLVTAGCAHCGDNSTTPPYFWLMQDIRSRPEVRAKIPPGGGALPVAVETSFEPFDVLDVDDVSQIISVTATFGVVWNDPALSWDPSPGGPYPGLYMVELGSQELWSPMVFVMNGASDRILDLGSAVILSYDGNVTKVTSPVFRFSCAMDLKAYPFDVQTCRLIVYIGSTVLIVAKATTNPFINRQSIQEHFSEGAEWTIDHVGHVEKVSTARPDQYVEFHLTVRRKTTFYVTGFLVPIVLTSYMNTLVFAIPEDSGERVSFLVSIFVSNAVFISFCTEQMPQGMDSVPLVMYLLLGTIMESGILVLLVSFQMRRRQRRDSSHGNIVKVHPLDKDDVDCKKAKPEEHPPASQYRGHDVVCFVFFLLLNSVFITILFFTMTKE